MDDGKEVGFLKCCMNSSAVSAMAENKHVSSVAAGIQQSVNRAVTAETHFQDHKDALDACHSVGSMSMTVDSTLLGSM